MEKSLFGHSYRKCDPRGVDALLFADVGSVHLILRIRAGQSFSLFVDVCGVCTTCFDQTSEGGSLSAKVPCHRHTPYFKLMDSMSTAHHRLFALLWLWLRGHC